MLGVDVKFGRAVTEIFVIVAGVLIALGADSWWTDRQEVAEESEILRAIEVDVARSQELLDRHFRRLESGLEALRILGEGVTGDAGSLDNAALSEMLLVGLWDLGRMNVQMSAYEEIKSSGRLRLISDPELRRSLAEYETSLTRARQREVETVNHQQRIVDPYVIENVQISQFADKVSSEWTESPTSLELENLRLLLDDIDFQNHIAAKYMIFYSWRNASVSVRDNLDELGDLVRARLIEVEP